MLKGLKRFSSFYVDSYRGLSMNSWMLAITALINRSGSMVLPFMGLYLKESEAFDLSQVGILLALYGIGSAFGSLLGGMLTDKLGAFWVQFYSLSLGGLGFIVLSFVHGFYGVAAAIVLVSTLAESLRPANMSAIAQYAKPENITRAISLNRMAINLGFSIGPAIGGVLALYNYKYIFWFDGATCILASGMFFLYFHKQEARSIPKPKTAPIQDLVNVLKDKVYRRFILYAMMYAILFFQIFNSIPLYLRGPGQANESIIGLLFAINGGLVFLLEMPLVSLMEKKVGTTKSISIGFALVGLGLASLLLPPQLSVFILCFVLLSISEILALPFLVSKAASFTTSENRGRYMGVYALGFSISHILAPSISLNLIEFSSFQWLWIVLSFSGLALACLPLFKKESST